MQPWIFESKRKKGHDLVICKVQEASLEVSNQVLRVFSRCSLHHLCFPLPEAVHHGSDGVGLVLQVLHSFVFHTAAAVQQLVQESQHHQGNHSEDEYDQDNKAGSVPVVVERVDFLHLEAQILGNGCGSLIPVSAVEGCHSWRAVWVCSLAQVWELKHKNKAVEDPVSQGHAVIFITNWSYLNSD